MTAPRIFLIHATPVAVDPINQAFARLWPEAELANLLEDSLSRDLAAEGRLSESLSERFLALARYAQDAGAAGILFTCSAFGEAIEQCQQRLTIPVLKPNHAMIEEAVARTRRIAILASFEPAIDSMTDEFHSHAAAVGKPLELSAFVCPEALQALHAGDTQRHDDLLAEMAAHIEGVDIICFAQFSMVSALPAVRAATSLPVLATTDSAVMGMYQAVTAYKG
ncbi:aspartate/glutamate racemase family protein [Oceanisphaera psychrotolerans]|uniref:Arylsulfatase n=1 Tax=Oceanisphaera psychrotolerans TaxID=1414654 RepID=A0A1J4QH53_9GAMM|nr:aspartate/glutamate racemase family protein [Oceanisphaera psychrotolerans]OIN12196.1 arylsulfatase [Oceanisphaera psychrotolerans]